MCIIEKEVFSSTGSGKGTLIKSSRCADVNEASANDMSADSSIIVC